MTKYFLTNKLIPCIGITLLAFLLFMLLLGAGYMIGVPMSPIYAPCAFLLGGLSASLLLKSWRTALYATIISAIFIALAAWLCSMIYDTSFDSIGYHYETVIMLAHGWNPMQIPPPNGNIWAEHYARGIELMQACFLAFTGNLQSVKCINFIFLAATLLILWYAMSLTLPRINWRGRTWAVCLAGCNIILVLQLLSGYNDYALWLETLLLVSAFALTLKNPRNIIAYFIIFVTVAIGANTKFTHLVYIGIECLGFALICVAYNHRKVIKPGIISVIAGLVVGIAFIGFNPYITNSLHHSNPVYPLLTDKVDIMTENTPEMMKTGGRVINLAKSLLSLEDKPWCLLRLDFDISGIITSYSSSSRVNGFGAAMPILLLAGLILMIINHTRLIWWIIYIGVWVMSLLFEQSWWARYIPFLWLNVWIPFVLSLNNPVPHHRLQKFLRSMIIVLAIAGAVVCGAGTLVSRIGYTHYFKYLCDRSRELHQPIVCANMSLLSCNQFVEQGVDFKELSPETEITHNSEFFRIYGNDFFDSVMLLPQKDYPQIYAPANSFLDRIADYPSRRY